jgi:hypothetical protein
MTEEQWLSCADPMLMLEFLSAGGPADERKLRLFAAACSRRVWGRIDALGRAAVEVAEAFADGLAGPGELRGARLACKFAGAGAAWYAAASSPAVAARNAALSAQAGLPLPSEGAAQAALLRDVVGNPFRPAALDPTWLTAGVVALARSAYEERTLPEGHLDLRRLAVLADALEGAGCTDAAFLGHLRGEGPHWRGCWAVDLVRRVTR